MADSKDLLRKELAKAHSGRLTRVTGGQEENQSRTKLVFVHGFGKGPKYYWRLIKLLLDTKKRGGNSWEREVFVYRFGWFWADAEAIARELARAIIGLLERDPEARLILVGHSLGGALARRAILLLLEEWKDCDVVQARRIELYA